MLISWGLSGCHTACMVAGLAEARLDFEHLVGIPLEAAEFSHEVFKTLDRLLPFDGWCLAGLDPENGLRQVQFGGRGTERTVEMARNEALMPDVNKYADLAAAVVPAGTLSLAHPAGRASFRLNEVLIPQGFHSEARVALRDRGRLCGALVLFREDPRRVFDGGDAATLCAVADPLTRALRRYPVRALPRRGVAPGSGVVAVSPDDRLVAISDEAQAWLDDLVPGDDDQTYPSDVTRVIFDATHAVRRGHPEQACTCVRTVSGHWLRVEGSAVAVGEADVVVVLRPATVQELLATVADHHGLTPREAEVLGLAAHGLPSKHIARELGVSLLTINGHLQALYRKCGASGREELLGRLV